MRLLAVDGNSILNRAFYGIRLLTTKSGEFTNGIYGFLNILFKVRGEVNPDTIVVCFDLRAKTFRHEMYGEYKAGRKGMPDELASQMPVLKEVLGAMGIAVLECEGYEADDLLGTLASGCEEKGWSCVIATGDRDSFQLISDNTSVRYASTKMGRPETALYDPQKIMEEYGLQPGQLIDLKAIEGDKSDNIPGVAGIGKVGALDLIKRFGSIHDLYQNMDSPDIKESARKKLTESKENAFLSLKLGEINRNVPIERNPEAYTKQEPDTDKLLSVFTRLEFFSFIKQMGLTGTVPPPDTCMAAKFKYCGGIDSLAAIEYDRADVYFESDRIYITTGGNVYDVKVSSENLAALFSRPLRLYNLKETLSVFGCASAENVVFDAVLAAYLISPSGNDYSADRLFSEYGVGADFEEEPPEPVKAAAKMSVLFDVLEEKISTAGMKSLLLEIEIPLSAVLYDMEQTGFLIDKEGIKDFGRQLREEILSLEGDIAFEIGEDVNVASPKQLGIALFEGLGLPHGKKTKTGYSTNAEVLEKLREYHPVIQMILDWRAASKLKSTYADGLLAAADGLGRIHTKFNQTETRTGRLSSSEPNLQNIPVRRERGRQLRQYFVAGEGNVLVSADYSQIELRILAHMAGDEVMLGAFLRGDDIHTITAAQVFKVPEMFVNKTLRSRAKAVNFGIVYGISAFSLSNDIGVSVKEAKEYINGYFDTYKGVFKYMENAVKDAKTRGFAETLMGRRLPIPELSASNANLRGFGERVARNMPIQGTAADIMKKAMINVHKRLSLEGFSAKIILQIHDELILEAPESEAPAVKIILEDEMEKAAGLKVPLEAKAAIGRCWYDAK